MSEGTSGGENDHGGDNFSFMTTNYPSGTLSVNNRMTPINRYTSSGIGIITFTVTGHYSNGIYRGCEDIW